jgi:hypothetical protein
VGNKTEFPIEQSPTSSKLPPARSNSHQSHAIKPPTVSLDASMHAKRSDPCYRAAYCLIDCANSLPDWAVAILSAQVLAEPVRIYGALRLLWGHLL